MDQELLNKIKQKPKYYDYLKENTDLIKNFNRYKIDFKTYENFLKDKYKLRITDKISNTIDNIDLVANIINSIK